MVAGNAGLPAFVDVGQGDRLLPDGVHAATVEEMEEAFVGAFPGSLTRRQVFRRWTSFRELVRGVVSVEHEYIDGSFVTDRPNPADVDLSLWIDAEELNGLPLSKERYFERLLSQGKAYKCHPFVVPMCSHGHADYGQFVYMKGWTERYWRSYKKANGTVVPGVAKGYVEVIE